jgi:tRNA (guanine-N7-)-methyltransferase
MRSDPYADAPRLPEGDVVDPRALVGAGSDPIELEIGPGRGMFALQWAELHPESRLVALEIRRKLADGARRPPRGEGARARARVFAEDAGAALPRLGPDGSVAWDRGTISPTPGGRSATRSAWCSRTRSCPSSRGWWCPGGTVLVQTDVEARADGYQQVVAEEPAFLAWEGGPRVSENPYGARSPRERRAIEDGLPVVRMRWRRRSAGESPDS